MKAPSPFAPLSRRSVLALSAVALLTLAGCRRNEGAGRLTLAGSTSVQPFAETWAEAYKKSNPSADIRVQGGGSTAGVQAALTGAAQIGMCSRELKKDEADKLKAIVVARDGLTIIVHPSNPVASLTVEQVRKVFSGGVPTWSELGGTDAKLTAVTREEGSGARGAFEELAMKGAKIAASALVQDSQGAVRQMVSKDPSAVGYVSHGVVDASVKALKIGGIEASESTIDAGTYPFVRPFLFVVKGEPTAAAKGFIDWVLGPDGVALTRKQGLLPPKS